VARLNGPRSARESVRAPRAIFSASTSVDDAAARGGEIGRNRTERGVTFRRASTAPSRLDARTRAVPGAIRAGNTVVRGSRACRAAMPTAKRPRERSHDDAASSSSARSTPRRRGRPARSTRGTAEVNEARTLALRRWAGAVGAGFGYSGDRDRAAKTFTFGCACADASSCACTVSTHWSFALGDESTATERGSTRGSARWFVVGGRICVKNAFAKNAFATMSLRLRRIDGGAPDKTAAVTSLFQLSQCSQATNVERFDAIVESLARFRRLSCEPQVGDLFKVTASSTQQGAGRLPVRLQKDNVALLVKSRGAVELREVGREEFTRLTAREYGRPLSPTLFPSQSVVLCIAAGRGLFALRAAKKYPTKVVLVCDIAGKEIERDVYEHAAKTGSNMIVVRCDARKLPWESIPKGSVYKALFTPPCGTFAPVHGLFKNFSPEDLVRLREAAAEFIKWAIVTCRDTLRAHIWYVESSHNNKRSAYAHPLLSEFDRYRQTSSQCHFLYEDALRRAFVALDADDAYPDYHRPGIWKGFDIWSNVNLKLQPPCQAASFGLLCGSVKDCPGICAHRCCAWCVENDSKAHETNWNKMNREDRSQAALIGVLPVSLVDRLLLVDEPEFADFFIATSWRFYRGQNKQPVRFRANDDDQHGEDDGEGDDGCREDAIPISNFSVGDRLRVQGSFNDKGRGYVWFGEILEILAETNQLRVRWLERVGEDVALFPPHAHGEDVIYAASVLSIEGQ